MALLPVGAEIFDVTLPFSNDLPVWPTHPKINVSAFSRIARGDSSNVSLVSCSSHSGTHVDALWHFEDERAHLLEIPLERWIGPCWLIAIPDDVQRIEPEHLAAAKIPPGTERLIIKTSNSLLWQSRVDEFEPRFVGLSPAAARWIVEHEIRLVGIDYLSVEPYEEPGHATHHILLGNDVVIVEGLDLLKIEPGPYDLLCLPMKLEVGDGAPARVLLVRQP